ncbi:solute carrier organic anion transporter family member 4A1-like [Macrosteles quadrilineatus]|uniref:solute carrier organic anion transporter family member 4A1-like n=1 Tax=Macrosteles quadrilineatus TaxID=74068 RepID=UPI0023E1DFD0|nr:solute carrier organic anion transporter family member 4A1-like [Macrosteles quadrilineatus]
MSEGGEGETPDYRCGWLTFKPDWLQKFNTTAWALAIISSAAFLQGVIVNGILHLMIPTIEHGFNLRSFKSGLVSGGYDIASLLCLIPVTYLGGRHHASKPKWIGLGVFIMGIGALVFSSPYFLTKNTHMAYFQDSSGICTDNENTSHKNCDHSDGTHLSSFMWIFFIGNLLHGAGASPLFTLGVTFLDESVVKKKTGITIGVYYTAATFGIAVGYVVGGYFLQLPEDFLSVSENVFLTPASKTWVGAWWLGFVIFGFASIILSVPILALPARMPGWEEAIQSKLSECVVGRERNVTYSKLKELPKALSELMRNTSLILLNFAGCCEGLIVAGSGAFVPKIIQSQFNLSSKSTAMIMGIITVPSAILGCMVGGGILKKFDLRFIGTLRLCIGTCSLSMLCAFCFLIYCADEKMVGVNMPYYADRKVIQLSDPCNEKCGCSGKEFMPICGINNFTYFSPCHAGCHGSQTAGDITLYSNCSCIEEAGDNGVQATTQVCKSTCPLLPLFLILMYLSLFFTFTAAMPALTATLRCVKSDQRSLALGIQWMLVRMLGMIPGPLLFGIIIDGTCLYWHAGACSEGEGSCILYDHYLISRSMVLMGCGWKSLEIILFALSIYFYKKDIQTSTSRS